MLCRLPGLTSIVCYAACATSDQELVLLTPAGRRPPESVRRARKYDYFNWLLGDPWDSLFLSDPRDPRASVVLLHPVERDWVKSMRKIRRARTVAVKAKCRYPGFPSL